RSGRHLAAVSGAENLGFAAAGDRDLAVEDEHLRVEIMRVVLVDCVGGHLTLPDIFVALLAQSSLETRFVHNGLPSSRYRSSTRSRVLTALSAPGFSSASAAARKSYSRAIAA